jgi:ribosomal protein S27E
MERGGGKLTTMQETGSERDGARYVAVQCRDCGAGLRARAWHEGIKCPKCGATNVEPLAAPGGAVDYTVADRSQGTTSADVMFAEWARWCEHITANQFNQAVHRQNSELQEQNRSTPIHELMIRMGFMDEERAVGVLRFLTVGRPNADDEDFVARLLKRPGIDRRKVAVVQEEQKALAGKRNEVPPVCQLLVQRRVIDESTMLDVLHEQDREGHGALRMALAMSRPVPKETLASKVRRRAEESPHFVRNAILLAVLVALTAGVWAWRLGGETQMVFIRCPNCGRLSQTAWSATDWPARCPRCGARAAEAAVVCENNHLFSWPTPYNPVPCPVCGTRAARLVTQGDLDRGFRTAGTDAGAPAPTPGSGPSGARPPRARGG